MRCSAANYAIGITAVLPTGGHARQFSGVTCRDMVKCATIGSLTPAALAELAPTIVTLARHEGLHGHAAAAQERPCEGPHGSTGRRAKDGA